MKRSIVHIVIVVALAVTGAAGFGCRNGGTQGDVGTVAYACPMRCEEDKTYDRLGNCPLCGMDLVEVKGDGTLAVPVPPAPEGGAGSQ